MNRMVLLLGLLALPLRAEDPASPGDRTVRLEHEGRKRSYIEKIVGPSTTVIDANEEIWRFFSSSRL